MLYISKFKINYLFIYFWHSISILHSDELVNFPPKYFLIDFEPRNNRIVHLFQSDSQEWDKKLMPPEPLIYGWRTDFQKFRCCKFQTVQGALYVQCHVRLMKVLEQCLLPMDFEPLGEHFHYRWPKSLFCIGK